jgi:hypothetical protein
MQEITRFGVDYVNKIVNTSRPFHTTKGHQYFGLDDKHILRKISPSIAPKEALKAYAAERVFEYLMPKEGQKFGRDQKAHLLKPVAVCIDSRIGAIVLEKTAPEATAGVTNAKETSGLYQALQRYGIEFDPAQRNILTPDELLEVLNLGKHYLTETSGRVHPEALKQVQRLVPIEQKEALRRIAVAYVLGATSEVPTKTEEMHQFGLLKKELSWEMIMRGSQDPRARSILLGAMNRFSPEFITEPFDWEEGCNINNYGISQRVYSQLQLNIIQQKSQLEKIVQVVSSGSPLSIGIL